MVAFLLGYRAAALRMTSLRDAFWSALTLRGRDRDRGGGDPGDGDPAGSIGPALLTLAFYLWDASTARPRRAGATSRWLWQIVLLAVLGIIVVAWNLLLRG